MADEPAVFGDILARSIVLHDDDGVKRIWINAADGAQGCGIELRAPDGQPVAWITAPLGGSQPNICLRAPGSNMIVSLRSEHHDSVIAVLDRRPETDGPKPSAQLRIGRDGVISFEIVDKEGNRWRPVLEAVNDDPT